jgi:hypothetical protein
VNPFLPSRSENTDRLLRDPLWNKGFQSCKNLQQFTRPVVEKSSPLVRKSLHIRSRPDLGLGA